MVSPLVWISCTAVAAGAIGLHTSTLAATSGDPMARLGLVSAPGPVGGRYEAGVAIVMAQGAHTYWKQPGDAGVPPVFAFNGSDNVAAAEVRFPVPTRLNEDGIVAFGYRDKVVFPVIVTPKDATRPAVLKVDVTYAVCAKICVPAHGEATMTLTPGGAGDDGTAVTAALAAVPHPAGPDQRKALEVKPKADAAKPSWTVTWTGPGALDDLFAEPPDGYFFSTTKTGANSFTLTAEQTVSAPGHTEVPVKLTLARAGGNLETTETLDVAPPTR